MNRYIIVDGLPYLYAKGKAYAVRWDDAGFTVGAEVKLKSAPAAIFNERSIKAKCANNLDSIRADTKPETQPDIEGTALEDMTVVELREYAKVNEIDLDGARLKAEIIAAIKAAEE